VSEGVPRCGAPAFVTPACGFALFLRSISRLVLVVGKGQEAGAQEPDQIVQLHNLEVLPPTGFTVICFPAKIRAASAGWTRAVAVLAD